MDATVSARFFRVSEPLQGKDDFPELLLNTMKAEKAGDRERILDGGITLRLERCASDDHFITGEFCRKQTTNIPPGAGPGGLSPINLEEGFGLGHVSAFRYHKPTRVLLLQHNPQSANPLRIGVYLASPAPESLFTFSPILRKDAWARFANKRIRKFEIRFASPDNLEALDDENIGAAKGARIMAEAYGGVTVTMSVGVGRGRKKSLIREVVETTINSVLGSDAKVRKLKVETGNEDGEPPINFLKEHLKAAKDLTLPENNPDDHYAVRSAYLKEVFSANIKYLEEHFGPKIKK